MTVVAMSRKEIDRVHGLRDLNAQRITINEAALLMRLTRRQGFRLAKHDRQDGPAALASKRRSRPSNRSHPAAVRTEALALIRATYADFGPTLAAEKLALHHGLRLGVETLRQWMLADGIWKDRKQRLARVHQPRYRRPCMGELIQIDGSDHRWFESRGPRCPSSSTWAAPTSGTARCRTGSRSSLPWGPWPSSRSTFASGGRRSPSPSARRITRRARKADDPAHRPGRPDPAPADDKPPHG